MLRSLIAVLAISTTAVASDLTDLMQNFTNQVVHVALAEGLNMNVGDTATYNMTIATFLKGTMTTTVKSVAPTAIVIEQTIAISTGNVNQSCEETIDPSTGQISSMVCNGQQQNQQDPGPITVVEEKEATIKVPAGTFDTIYIKVTEGPKAKTVEQWVAPKQIPVFGLAKSIAPFTIGTATMELASYRRF